MASRLCLCAWSNSQIRRLDVIRQANEAQESSADVKERIQDLKKKHLNEVRTLYEWQAQDYYDEVLDMSRSKPEVEFPEVEV